MAKKLLKIPGTIEEGRERSRGDSGKLNMKGRVVIPYAFQQGKFEKAEHYLVYFHERKPLVYVRFFDTVKDAVGSERSPLKLYRFQKTTAYIELGALLKKHDWRVIEQGVIPLVWDKKYGAMKLDLKDNLKRIPGTKTTKKRASR